MDERTARQEPKKGKDTKYWVRFSIWLALMAVLLTVFIVCGVLLFKYIKSTKATVNLYDSLDDLRQQHMTAPVQTQSQVPGQTLPELSEGEDLVEVTGEDGRTLMVLRELAPIYEKNNHLVGWISIDGTQISYPVLQTSTSQPDYYLKRDFEKKSNAHGAIYAEEECDVFAPSDNVTLYGHRMKDGTMFADLGKYKEKSFWQAHSLIQFDTLQEHHTYEIIAVFVVNAAGEDAFLYNRFINAIGENTFSAYVERCKGLSMYDTGVDARYGDKLLTLSTCEYSVEEGRLVVVAKRID